MNAQLLFLESENPEKPIARHCGRTYEEVERTLDRDHFMTAGEAKDWGLVDHVYSSRTALERRALTA